MSGDEQWKGSGALGHKSCLTTELELRERIAELEEYVTDLKDKGIARSRIIDAATVAQETERKISEDYKTKWHVALEEIERMKVELSRHHLTNSCANTYHNEGCADSHRTVCDYR